ncbi:neuronal membrane glycoprotein M6-b-like [Anneissia japonica]|uniref:neuronal membrane glycoprotein M6-b-like n=1 Tax=Anneissia japonica TaxID=1529436 RepID=UPI0014258C2F|nr:neuronal membrane glycoprotein M6-b-like [Anneissia japonica]
MVFGGSTASFDSSFVGALYGDYEDEESSCCSRCCQRYPWPSISAGIFILCGIAVWCATVTIASGEMMDLFSGTVAEDEFDQIFTIAQYATYGATSFMSILGFVLIAIGCLATGAVRRYHICRFRSRSSGICQTTTFLILTYIVFLGWMGVVVVSMFPVVFFSVQKQTNCQVEEFSLITCIDLEEWGFVDDDEEELDSDFCSENLEKLCTGNLYRLFFMATMSAVLICVGLAQFLATLSYNSAKLRHRYTAHNQGKSGSYNLRASYRAGSFRSTRNPHRGSTENNATRQTKYDDTARYQSRESIDRLKKEYARDYSSREFAGDDYYSQQGSRERLEGKGSHELSTISTFYGGDSNDGRYNPNIHREYHI